MHAVRLLATCLICLWTFHLTSDSVSADGGYTKTVLGTLGGSESKAFDINNSGTVVGNSNVAGDAAYHAFKWTAADGMVDLGTPGGTHSSARGINDDGVVVGAGTVAGVVGSFAAKWMPDGTVVLLGGVADSRNSMALAINSNGVIVGFSTLSNIHTAAFMWTPDGGVTNLGLLLGTSSCTALSINDLDVVVGACSSGAGATKPFRWTAEEGMVDIGTLGGPRTYATGINNAGAIAGFGVLADGETERGFVWTQAAGMVQIGTLGGTHSSAEAINNNGLISGQAYPPGDAGYHPIAWSQLGGMVDLDPTGGLLTIGLGINDLNQIVGIDDELRRGVLFTPVPNTITGENVSIAIVPSSGSSAPITLTFGSVTGSGNTAVTVTGPEDLPPPAGFKLGDPPVYYHLETTATFTGGVTVCIDYSSASYSNPTSLRLFHFENGAWVDQTSSLDLANSRICALVTSFSPFAIFERAFNFTGFFAPVDNGAILNAVRAGSAVPIKFALGGAYGLSVLETGYPKSIAVSCDSSAVDVVEETVAASASGLSYDVSTGQYQYVWKTDKSWVGCREFVLKVNDGTTKTAKFKF